MIPEKLHLVRAGRTPRPMALKLALAALAISTLAATQAQAQFDTGGYTSTSTPQARYQQQDEKKKQAQEEGIIGADGATGPIPELQVFAAVSLAETYTTNAFGDVGGSSGYDFYTQPALHLGATEQSRRLMASLNYTLSGQIYARNNDLNQLLNQLDAMANAELIEQTLFLDAQASATPLALTRTGSLGNGTPTNDNYRNTYSYAVRPTLIHQFGSTAETDLWVSQSGVYFVTPSSAAALPLPGYYSPPSNSNTTSVGARIASLSDFVRFRWSLNASASDTYQAQHQSQKVRSATANLSYSVTNDLSVIFTGGYQTYHSSYLLTKDLDGPILLGGFQFAPSPNFYFFVQAGTQNNFPTYIGSLNWNVTPLTAITASATDQVSTPQQQLMSNLQNPAGGPSAGGGIPGTGGTPGTVPIGGYGSGGFLGDGLSIDNSIYRNRAFQAAITHSLIRTQFSFSVFANLRDRLDSISTLPFLDPHEDNYGLGFLVSHKLRRDLSGTLGFTASRANEFGGHDRIFEGDAGISYSASATLSFYANTAITNRESTELVGFNNGNLTDVRVSVGVTKSF